MTWNDRDATLSALVLDDLFCHPDAAELLRAIRDAGVVPSWLEDQFAAAGDQARGGAEALVVTGRMHRGPKMPTVDHPEWVRLGLFHTFSAWVLGRGSTCMHSPVVTRPEPLFAAAWRPLLMVCGQCGHLFNIGNPEKDRTCDGCGVVGDTIYPAMAQAGFITYMFGVCDQCRYWDTDK